MTAVSTIPVPPARDPDGSCANGAKAGGKIVVTATFPPGAGVPVRFTREPGRRPIGYAQGSGRVLLLCRGACGQWRPESEFHPLSNPASRCKLASECRYCACDRRKRSKRRARALETLGVTAQR